MGIVLGSNFEVQTALPLDDRTVVADTTARDAIDSLRRYEGMIVYVEADETNYQLVGGITNSDWTELSGSGGGGGGGALRLIAGPNAPILIFEDEIEKYEYTPGLGQALYLAIKIPSTYTPGTPVSLKILWECASTSGNALINAVSTLIRSEVDVISSTTNQHTSTNAAITMAAGSANEPQVVTLDLAPLGEVNSVAISPNDLLKVKIQESSSTVADNIKFIPDAIEVIYA